MGLTVIRQMAQKLTVVKRQSSWVTSHVLAIAVRLLLQTTMSSIVQAVISIYGGRPARESWAAGHWAAGLLLANPSNTVAA